MKHEDFRSIEIDDVLVRVLEFAKERTRASGVHWLSAYGLTRLQTATEENMDWALASAEVIGRHMWSYPAADVAGLYQMWHSVSAYYPAPHSAQMSIHQIGERFAQPLFFEGQFLGLIVMDRPAGRSPVDVSSKVSAGFALASRYIYFAYQHLEAKNQSYIDEVTGLHNQRYLPMALDHEIQRAKREKSKFTLLFLDIDYFKLVNDGRGHWVGSKLLLELGKVLRAQVRTCDYTFRYGGDEFIVILGGSDADGARIVAERMRSAIESHTFAVEGHSLNLTVSIGLATFPEHAQNAQGLIHLADQAMYSGKRKSRNIVFVAS